MRYFTRPAIALILATMLLPNLAGAADNRDFRPLTKPEAVLFFPLACNGGHDGCAKAGSAVFERGDYAKVLYGSFSGEGADEALVTYRNDGRWGVGAVLLFARSNGRWHPVRSVDAPWTECTEIPNTVPQRLLCRFGYTEQGINTQWFYVWQVAPAGTKDPGPYAGQMLFHKDEGPSNQLGCDAGAVPKGKAFFTGFAWLHASSTVPYFAAAGATYETAEDIASACGGPHQRKVRESTGEIRFSVAGGQIRAVTPVPFVNAKVQLLPL